ncbi:MAG: hypothetical protein IPK84_03525 [Candidatus Moraniibacteriota bacterium]|nr:MAG: hypothetical protein IPK84_03525 [Candidatus Moranbacteria bacterium]
MSNSTIFFEEALREVGVSDVAIAALIDNEYTDVSQLTNLDVNDFLALGIKGRPASLLAEKFGRRSGGQSVDLDQSTSKQPIKVEVSLPKSFDQMGTSELLSQLADTSNADALSTLLGKPEVIAASARTDSWAIPGTGGTKLDVDATMAYIRYLGKPGATPQRLYQGRRPKSIHVILGVVEKTLVNPFTGEPVVEGLDASGNDWSKTDRILMKAILWARFTRHRFFPAAIDPFSAFEEISQQPLPRRWQGILDDYNAAVEDEDPAALGVSLAWKAPTATNTNGKGDTIGGVAAEQRTRGAALDPESFVRAKCQGAGTLSGMDSKLVGVFSTVAVSGMNQSVCVIVLDSFKVSGMNQSGVVYLAPGAVTKGSGMGNTISIERKSWEQLAQIAREW